MKVVIDKKEMNKRNKQIETGLQSTKPTEILRAIKMLRKDGEEGHVMLVIKALHSSQDDEVSNEIIKFLNDLKIQIAMPPIMEALNDKELESGTPVREQLPKMENKAMFSKLREKTLSGAKKVMKAQEDGSSLTQELADKERYSDIAESGMSMEDKEALAAQKLSDKKREMGLE